MESEDALTPEDQPGPNKGVFITKGMQVTIPAGGLTLSIGPDGRMEADPVVLHVGLDMCPYWIEIALQHLRETEVASEEAHAANEKVDNERKGNALRAEFMAGMQTIVASGVAMDSFYASVKDFVAIPEEVQRAWKEKRAARYKQTAEVFRRGFPLSRESFKTIREFLKELASFRGRAVHPPSGTSAPVHHPELDIVTEWRYVVFRLYNAKAALRNTLSVIAQLASKADPSQSEPLFKYCEGLLPKLNLHIAAWESNYGPLSDRKPSPS